MTALERLRVLLAERERKRLPEDYKMGVKQRVTYAEIRQLLAHVEELTEALEGLVLACAPGMPMLLDTALDRARAVLGKGGK